MSFFTFLRPSASLLGRLPLLAAVLACCLALAGASSDNDASFGGRPDVEVFIGEMVTKHGFAADDLRRLFSLAQRQPGVLKAFSGPPGKSRPWYQYRSTFLTPLRVDSGVRFWENNGKGLENASAHYGVPPEVVIGILGVETRYGAITGSFRVFDALATLAFDFPRRADFFRQELEAYLLLTRDEGIDPLSLKGSYAGAMGIPQFMPGSYRRYAVDSDGDGRRDLWRNESDAIGSVANYLKRYGWETGAPVAVRATVKGEGFLSAVEAGIKPQFTVAELRKLGVEPLAPVEDDRSAALIALDTPDGQEYWLAFQNFYVITRYNRSVNYAMAVYQLGQEVAAARRDNVALGPLQKAARLISGR